MATITVALGDVIKQYRHKEVSTKQLAEIAGFTEEQMKFVDLFWDSAFNKSMIYLDDEMILENLTTATGKNAVNDFIRRILKPNFKEGVDYLMVDKDHPSVKSRSASTRSENLTHGGANKEFFLVTGEALKMMLQMAATKKGGVVRDYFIKIEGLVVLMRDYMNACKDRELRLMTSKLKKLLREKKKADERAEKAEEVARETIDKKNRVIDGMKSLVETTHILVKEEWIYAVTCINDRLERISIIGKTVDLKHRLSEYNCKKTGDGVYYYTYFRRCCKASQVENTIRQFLKPYLVAGKKDAFKVREDYLHPILDAAVDGQDNIVDLCNELIEAIKTEDYYESKITMPALKIPIEVEVTEEEPEAEPLLESLPQEILEQRVKELLELYICREHDANDFKYDHHKDTEFVVTEEDGTESPFHFTVTWSEFVRFIRSEMNQPLKKVTAVKTALRPLVKDAKAINGVWDSVN